MAAAASAFRASQWDTKWEVLLHYVEALLCCMYGCIVCMYGQKMRHKASWLKPVCLTHCSSTTPTKWRQQKKKKEEKIPVFLLRRAPQRGCSTYSCGTRHHFSPLWKKKRRRRKKSVPRMNRTKHFVFSSFFLAVCPPVKINGGSTIKRKHCSATHAPWLVEMWHHWRL